MAVYSATIISAEIIGSIAVFAVVTPISNPMNAGVALVNSC
jgi:hypothetical protein